MHEEGYHVERRADGTLAFRAPAGRLLPDVPAAPPVPSDPVDSLRTTHAAHGLSIHPRTATPSWLGERLDVGYAIDVLHPLAIGR